MTFRSIFIKSFESRTPLAIFFYPAAAAFENTMEWQEKNAARLSAIALAEFLHRHRNGPE